MRVVAVGAEPVGVIAIGANATGIVAVGQLATGVIAIGQLARGGIVLGQLGIGLVAVAQLAVGAGWSAGMVGVGGTSGPGLIIGLFGRLYALRIGRGRSHRPVLAPPHTSRPRILVGVVLTVALVALWWLAAGKWLLHDLTRPGGILVERPHVLR